MKRLPIYLLSFSLALGACTTEQEPQPKPDGKTPSKSQPGTPAAASETVDLVLDKVP